MWIAGLLFSLIFALSMLVDAGELPPQPQGLGQPEFIDVCSPRPLHEMCMGMESHFGKRIIFEDVPIGIVSALEVAPGVEIPRPRRLSVSFRSNETLSDVLGKLFSEYAKIEPAVVYASRQAGESFVVYPRHLVRPGRAVQYDALLARHVQVSVHDVTVEKCLDSLVSAMSSSDVRVLSSLATGGIERRTVTFDYAGDAGTGLDKLLTVAEGASNGSHAMLLTACLLKAKSNTVSLQRRLERRSKQVDLRVDALRPMAEAIALLENRMHVRIGFEESPLLEKDLLWQDREGRVLGPTGGIIITSYVLGDVGAAIQACVEPDGKCLNVPLYGYSSRDGFWHVFPKTLFQHGTRKIGDVEVPCTMQVDVQPLLDAKISLKLENVSREGVIKRICAAVSECKVPNPTSDASEPKWRQIRIGSVPESFRKDTVSYSAIEQTGRQCITDVVRAAGDDLSWRSIYEPGENGYVLDVYSVK